MGREPGAGLMRELEGWAEALSGTFNAQDLANTLWAYATMGREPGAGLMRALEGRAEALADTFNVQAVANTLWALEFDGPSHFLASEDTNRSKGFSMHLNEILNTFTQPLMETAK
jgi:hypothetical protein